MSKKKTATSVAVSIIRQSNSRGLDAGGLLALRAHLDLEADLLAFLQGLETLSLNFREMGEQIITAIVGSNEAEAFRIVEPLYGTSCHVTFLKKLRKSRNRPVRKRHQER
jgi:hypothetical protein